MPSASDRPRYHHVHVELHPDEEVSPLALVSRVGAALRRAGVPYAEREAFGTEAMAGVSATREQVVEVARRWVTVT